MATSARARIETPITERVERLRLQLVAGQLAEQMAARIRRRRMELGLNQRELAERIPSATVSNQTVSLWERAVNQPTGRNLDMLVEALEVDHAYLYERQQDKSRPTPNLMAVMSDESQLDRIEKMLESVLKRLDALERLPDQLADLEERNRRLQADLELFAAEARRQIEEAGRARTRRPQQGPPS
jgi:transcriptional regulator with XRE-family HTH domain